MKKYLCYDIRGIQSFIFRIPKLKYIIGGSALVDQFDRTTMPSLQIPGATILFAGGGKGTFICEESAIDPLKKAILAEANQIGIDIRFGCSEDYSEASMHATELHPYIPKNLTGKPCSVSGLYPVENGGEHFVVKKRYFMRGEKMFRYYEENLFKGTEWPADLKEFENSQFFHNVCDHLEDDSTDEDGKKGATSLGNRNRWAVICMDGNDMGSQLQKKIQDKKDGKVSDAEMPKWIQKMSLAIDNCSREATRQGIFAVIREWKKSKDCKAIGEDAILPIRPIIVGGDDISVICHVSYATLFVKTVMDVFRETSKKTPQAWPATGGEISISAGILYCPVSLPLHSAMAYAEALLASAKTRGREVKSQTANGKNIPSPESIDWESITDSVLTSPAAYRQKNLLFIDNDTGCEIRLTSRPCTRKEFEDIESLAQTYATIPQSTRSKILPAMHQNADDRLAFVSALAKNHFALANALVDPEYANGFDKYFRKETRWKVDGTQQTTDVLDALSLLEETKRMEKETV